MKRGGKQASTEPIMFSTIDYEYVKIEDRGSNIPIVVFKPKE
jgi:hypothetical protein